MKKEKPEKSQIGMFMDHAEARLIKPDAEPDNIQLILSTHISRVRIEGEQGDGTRLGNFRSTNNEAHKHNKEQNEVHAYYKQLAEALHPYDEILIFGPSTAPMEFHNYLIEEKKTSGKRIKVKKVDYITENQMREQVRIFFNEANYHA